MNQIINEFGEQRTESLEFVGPALKRTFHIVEDRNFDSLLRALDRSEAGARRLRSGWAGLSRFRA